MIKTDLGAVTAYAIAEVYGFTGTEEEFGTLQANSATNAQTAATAAETAVAAKNEILNSIDPTLSISGKAADACATGVLKSQINKITIPQNLFDKSTIISGGYYSGTGSITPNQSSYYSDQFIEVEAGTEYTFTAGETSSPYYIATYNSSKVFQSRKNPTGTTFTPETGIAFIRISIYNQAFKDDFKIAKTSDFNNVISDYIQLVNGEKITNAPFSPILTIPQVFTSITKDILTYGGNYYPGSDGTKTALNTQYWYEITAINDFMVWTDSELTYPDIMVAVYNNGTATKTNFVARYRKNSSENTLPTSSNKLSISRGQLLAISVSSDANFTFISNGVYTGLSIFKNGLILNEQMIDQARDRISVLVRTEGYIIKFKEYSITFSHIVNAGSRADLWNFNGISKNGQTLLGSSTDIIGVLREDGESDFMGGVHGDETVVDFHILADGVPITTDVNCDRIDILMYSHLTRVSTGNNVIDRIVHITITNGCIENEVTFISLIDNFNAYRVFAGGMWAWYEADKVYATSNLGEIVGTGSSGLTVQHSHDLYTATVITNNWTVTCENVIGWNMEGSYGEAFYYGNEQNPRMKIYLGSLKDITLNTGDIIKGKSRYTLA